MSQTLSHNFLDLDVETGVENGRLMAQLAAYGEVLDRQYTDTRVVVHCRIPQRALAHLHGADVSIRPRAKPTNGTAKNGNGHAGPLLWPLDGSLVMRENPNDSRN